jgi:dolichol kinase
MSDTPSSADATPPSDPAVAPVNPDDADLAVLVARTRGPQPWRRAFHAVNGLTLVGILVLVDPPWSWTVAALGGLTLLLFLSDLARFSVPALNRLFFRLLRPFASPREARGVASSTWYIAGCFLAVAVFPREVAVASILVLALADSVASYVGRRWGRRPFGSGSVEGSTAFFLVAFLVLVPMAGWAVAVVVAGITALVERTPWPLDDNLTVPLTAGLLLWSLLPFTG